MLVGRREFLKILAGAILILFLAWWVWSEKQKPYIFIEIFYSYHGTTEDVKGFIGKLGKADVVILETSGWKKELKADLTDLSYGRISPSDFLEKYNGGEKEAERLFKPYPINLLEAPYQSKKLLIFLDIPHGSPLAQRLEEHRSKARIDLTRNFQESISYFREVMKEAAQIQREREDQILKNWADLKINIEEGSVAELRGKKTIKILLFLGAFHTRIYDKLKEAGENVSQEFSTNPFILAHFLIEVLQRFTSGAEVSDDLIARGLFMIMVGIFLDARLLDLGAPTHDLALWQRKVIDSFGPDEIKSLFGGARSSEIPLLEFQRNFGLLLHLKGIRIPETQEELYAALKK